MSAPGLVWCTPSTFFHPVVRKRLHIHADLNPLFYHWISCSVWWPFNHWNRKTNNCLITRTVIVRTFVHLIEKTDRNTGLNVFTETHKGRWFHFLSLLSLLQGKLSVFSYFVDMDNRSSTSSGVLSVPFTNWPFDHCPTCIFKNFNLFLN